MRVLVHALAGQSYCPVCDNRVARWKRFVRDKVQGRQGVLCPHCRSFERTRQFKLWLDQQQVLRPGLRLLHFAPEPGLERLFRAKLGISYVTCDVAMRGVDRNEDITRLSFDDQSFDFIYCSNVLEHVLDDRKGMAELHRVLAVGGGAFLQVPIRGAVTYEDYSITDPVERTKHFGQSDHVRFYGEDFKDRLQDAGFKVDAIWLPDALRFADNNDIQRMNLAKRELCHYCRKER